MEADLAEAVVGPGVTAPPVDMTTASSSSTSAGSAISAAAVSYSDLFLTFLGIVFLCNIFALVGRTFLKLVFVHNVNTINARYGFTIVFTSTSMMFLLVIADMAGVFVYRQQLLFWALMLSLIMCVLVLPFIAVYGLLGDMGFPPRFLVGNAVSDAGGGTSSSSSSSPEVTRRNRKASVFKAVAALLLLVVAYYFTSQALPSDDLVYVDTTQRPSKSRSAAQETETTPKDAAPTSSQGLNDNEAVVGPAPVVSDRAKRRLTLAEHILSGAAYIGVAFMAVLGGFAAVATPLAYLRPFVNRSNREHSKAVLESTVNRFQHIMEACSGKKAQLAVLADKVMLQQQQGGSGGEAAAAAGGGSAGGGSGWGSWFKNKLGMESAESKNLTRMRSEVQALDQILTSLYLQVSEAEENYQMADFGQSTRAILFATFGIVMSFYCVGKVILTIFNLFFRRFSTVDPVTRFFTLVVIWTGVDLDVSDMVDRVALGFNAAMTLSAVRGLLIMIFRLTTRHLAGVVSPNTTVHFFTVFVGLHLIAMLLLMRLSLPPQNRGALTEVIGPLPFYYYHRWHDSLFVLSAIGTAVLKRLMLE